MWVKKSEWEDMKKQVKNIGFDYDRLSTQVYSLLQIHNRENIETVSMVSGDFNKILIAKGHFKERVQTNTIPDLTLEELSRYVIDGTPIKRKKRN